MSAFDVLSKGWLGGLPDQLGQRLCSIGQQVSYGSGELVHAAGAEGDHLIGCIRGSLHMSFAGGDGDLRFAHLLVPGMWTGSFAFLTSQPRVFELKAAESVLLLQIDHGVVKTLAQDHIEIWRWLAVGAAHDLGLAMTVADNLMIRDAGRRLAATLLRLSARIGAHPSVTPVDRLLLTQSDLADAANLSLSATGRFLRQLQSQGVIQVSYGEVRIVDAAALRAIVWAR